MMANGVASPPASSCGRLFDAVSFLCGLAPLETEYEAEAAMRLEDAAGRRTAAFYPFGVSGDGGPRRVSFTPALREIVADLARGTPISRFGELHERWAGVSSISQIAPGTSTGSGSYPSRADAS
jgi:hydrogenase maturation protein HypF